MNEGNIDSNWENLNFEDLLNVSGGLCYDYEGPYGPIHGKGALTILIHIYVMKQNGYSLDQTVQISGCGDPDLERFIRDHWDLLTSREPMYLMSLLEADGIASC